MKEIIDIFTDFFAIMRDYILEYYQKSHSYLKDLITYKKIDLFKKIEDEIIETEIQKLKSVTNKTELQPKEELMSEKISFEQFKKVDLRVATVIEAEKVEKADKLLKMKINLGAEQRTIIAGIALNYKPEEIVGKQVVVVANLEPAKIRGIESNGMLLAAVVDDNQLTLIVPKTEMPDGTKIS